MATETKYTRKGHIIRDRETNKETHYDSINAAKRESHKIQMDADKRLGSGILKVIT